ncbi:FAD:protein FMN transferase [Candidatus Neptunochlamydia vexilliferae]|uniref:FAD:protein FMN transferase n=1 Tax=Candidatus Neptunichlamydia vexilliferae TaxID=1651774 RepID=A0ABS0AYF3_9BACT|nr:FAD:protein FMN transferase [Candidatus Neptunochlamydia vexilliferae]MBF5059163.1 FAD:protein FMN transferase [Candidatus Neptunochlamydia vexilliferae]
MWLILFLALLFGCSKEPSHFQGVAHGHPYRIQIGGSPNKTHVQALLEEIFEEVDTLYNHWNPDSLLSKNPDSPELQPILSLAHSFCTLTNGWYDPTLRGPIQTFKTQTAHSPGYDLDGMLKGYVIDQIVEQLLSLGYTNLYVEWGGDLRVHGKHPSGRPWQILLNDEVVPLENGAIATSGCAEQTWDIDGTTYTHIINPFTQEMVGVGIYSVTVRAPTCALADALATACMASGSETFADAMKEKLPVDFWIVYTEKSSKTGN